MFGLGIGEIILIVLLIVILAPRDIPKIMRRVGRFFGMLRSLRDQVDRELEDVWPAEDDEKPVLPRRRAGPRPSGRKKRRARAKYR